MDSCYLLSPVSSSQCPAVAINKTVSAFQLDILCVFFVSVQEEIN